MRKGAPWLKTTLVQCAWAAARKKGSYLQAQFHRLRARRGAKKAIGAVAASILTAVYHMLKDGTLYHDLGADHFDRRAKAVDTRRLVDASQNLGYAVQITPLGRHDPGFCFSLGSTLIVRLLPVCSAVFGGSYRWSLWRHIRRPWFVTLRRNLFSQKGHMPSLPLLMRCLWSCG